MKNMVKIKNKEKKMSKYKSKLGVSMFLIIWLGVNVWSNILIVPSPFIVNQNIRIIKNELKKEKTFLLQKETRNYLKTKIYNILFGVQLIIDLKDEGHYIFLKKVNLENVIKEAKSRQAFVWCA